jgi:CcmD family protein
MTILIVSYLVAWASIGVYVLRLIVNDRRLMRRIVEIDGVGETTPHKPVYGKRVA